MRRLALLLLLLAGCEDPIRADCSTDGDCGANEACVEGACEGLPVECYVDSDCVSGVCRHNVCEAGLAMPEPVDADSVVTLEPGTELDFGGPVLGIGIVRTVSLINNSDAPFTVRGAELNADISDEMVLSTEPALPVLLSPGDRADVTVTYTLADGEEDQGTLTLETDADGCSPACADPGAITVDLISEFKGGRELNVAPTSWDFGFVDAGETSATKVLLLTNIGTLDKVLTLEQLTLGGDVDAFTFELPAFPAYIAPGESIEVPVVYAPSEAAPQHSLTFTVTANSDNPQHRVLSATFVGSSQPGQALVWNPPEVIFPELAIGVSAQEQVELENVGATPITVSNLVFADDEEYSFVAYAGASQVTFPRTVFPGDHLDVYVEYVSQSGVQSLTTLSALNDQASGDTPVLTLRGESFIPPGGPILDVVSGPVTKIDAVCGCAATADVSAANVDLSYRSAAGGQVCAKPANPACGLGGANCGCATMGAYGQVAWGGATVAEVRGEQWIIDEKIHHEGNGADGTFVVRADLIDDCLAVPGSTDPDVNHACCMWVDCESAVQACFDYGTTTPHCATSCEYFATVATSQDCLARGPVAIRTTVTVSTEAGAVVEQRHFCTVGNQSGAGSDVVSIDRQAGYFSIGAPTPGVVEVSAGQACPAP